MERHVKERLVGAAVLMAAAVILVPEMLSGPERPTRDPVEQLAGDTQIKTYTIDLNQPAARQAASEGIDNRSPPPEQTPSVPVERSASDAPTDEPVSSSDATSRAGEPATQQQAKPETNAPPPEQSSAKRGESPAVTEPNAREARSAPAATQPARPAVASAPSVPTSSGWAVQIGSYSKAETATRLVSELRADGQDAFVMPVRAGGATLYRVRVGPMKDRSSAEAALRVLRSRTPGAAVVVHP